MSIREFCKDQLITLLISGRVPQPMAGTLASALSKELLCERAKITGRLQAITNFTAAGLKRHTCKPQA